MNTLYKLDSKGKIRSWEIQAIGGKGHAVIITTAGLLDGAKTKTEVEVTAGKNIGRSNETTPLQQAVAEAQATWDSKIRSGYVEDVALVKQSVLGSGIPAPMLAQKYSPDGSQKSSKTLAQMKLLGQKIHVQPKFDGNRCLVKVNAEGVELYTRKGDRMLRVQHIEAQIFKSYLSKIDDGATLILDGELYTNEFSFNTLNGLLKRENKTPEQMDQLEKVNYHVYDAMVADLSYSQRYELLSKFESWNVKVVESREIFAYDDQIRFEMENFLSEGYEGLMIRRLDTPYENKRSWSLVKYKDFQDAEYKLLDIIEDARGGGIVGAFVLELDAPSVDRDGKEIKTFRAGVKDLSQDEGRQMLEHKNEYIGRLATVEFFSLSEYGIPRFGKVKGFRSDL